MSKFIIAIALLILSLACFSQKHQDSLKITFLFAKQKIVDSTDLTVTVVYKNLTNRHIDIYQYLEEGDRGDRFYNINIQVQRFEKKFVYYPLRYYSSTVLHRIDVDSLRHFDLPKKKLPPLTTDTLYINLLSVAGMLDSGQYRLKVHLRVKTIRDNTPYNDPNFESAPPFDEMIYLESKWFSFYLEKPIVRRRYSTVERVN